MVQMKAQARYFVGNLNVIYSIWGPRELPSGWKEGYIDERRIGELLEMTRCIVLVSS
jgi:hypothetical protein